MKTKVSIVMPCYNKEHYISATIKSIYDQIWDNIEVIFVNDGSTDGTRDIINEWVPKLSKRSYSVLVLDQENSGVASAIKSGLEQANGNYVCFPDADDELLPQYVSAMTEILDNNPMTDFVSCRIRTRVSENEWVLDDVINMDYEFQCENRLEKLLLCKFQLSVCNYLFRKRLLDELGIPKNMAISPTSSQEPQILIPVFFSAAVGKMIHDDLYVYNAYARGLGSAHIKDPIGKILGDYHDLQTKTINLLPLDTDDKERLINIAMIGSMIHSAINISKKMLDTVARHFLKIIDNILTPYPKMPNKILEYFDIGDILQYISNRIMGKSMLNIIGKVYAYGSLGKRASRLLPILKGTSLWPSVFWDIAAASNSMIFDGTKVTNVKADAVCSGDIILCFPTHENIFNEAITLANNRDAMVYSFEDDEIKELLISFICPQLCDCRSFQPYNKMKDS